MKKYLIIILVGIAGCSGYGQKSIGVFKVVDERTNVDYSQFVLNLFNQEPVFIEGKPFNYKLINHFSQADIAFKVIISETPDCQLAKCDQITITSYLDGKKFDSSVLYLDCIDPSRVSITPDMQMGFEETETGQNKILSIPKGSLEEQKGLKPGYFFEVVQMNYKTSYVYYKENLFSTNIQPDYIELPNKLSYFFEIPLDLKTVDCVFKSIKEHLTSKFKFDSQKKKKYKPSSFTTNLISLRPNSGKEYPKDILPGRFPNITQIGASSYISGPIEKLPYYVNEKVKMEFPASKKVMKLTSQNAGNEALLNHIYYEEDHKEHKFLKQKEVNDEINMLINTYVDPINNKPGVVLNYLHAGDTYFMNGDFPAAINQYNASVNKLGDIHSGARLKSELKSTILSRLSSATDSLSMTNYANLLNASRQLTNYKLSQADFSERFYTTADTLSLICSTLEDQIREKKRQKTWGIIGAVASAGTGATLAGVTDLSEIGLDIATDFFTTGYELIMNSFEVSDQISNSIRETSASITISTQDFKLDNDEINNATHFTTAFVEAYDLTQNKQDVLDKVNEFVKDESNLMKLINNINPNEALTDPKNLSIIYEIGKLESQVYNYEVRKLQLPEKYKL